MSASNKMAKMSVDTIIKKIKAQVVRIQALKAFRVREYARQLFATVREKADGKGNCARIMTRGLCVHNDKSIMRA